MPLGVLQHYTIEPSNLEATKEFYCDVLGLENGDRPPLGFPGYWLYSGGVPTVHLLGPRTPREGIVVRGTEKIPAASTISPSPPPTGPACASAWKRRR